MTETLQAKNPNNDYYLGGKNPEPVKDGKLSIALVLKQRIVTLLRAVHQFVNFVRPLIFGIEVYSIMQKYIMRKEIEMDLKFDMVLCIFKVMSGQTVFFLGS